MGINLTEKAKIIKVGGYQSHDTGKSSTYVSMATANQVTFLVPVGTLAQTTTVFLYQSTTSSGGAAVAAKYQKSSTGVIDLSELDGALTTLTTSGVAMTASTDNYKMLAITVKAQDLTAGYKWVGIVTTASSGNNYVGPIFAIASEDRWGQAIPVSVQ